jgi:hypothetical protein
MKKRKESQEEVAPIEAKDPAADEPRICGIGGKRPSSRRLTPRLAPSMSSSPFG